MATSALMGDQNMGPFWSVPWQKQSGFLGELMAELISEENKMFRVLNWYSPWPSQLQDKLKVSRKLSFQKSNNFSCSISSKLHKFFFQIFKWFCTKHNKSVQLKSRQHSTWEKYEFNIETRTIIASIRKRIITQSVNCYYEKRFNKNPFKINHKEILKNSSHQKQQTFLSKQRSISL